MDEVLLFFPKQPFVGSILSFLENFAKLRGKHPDQSRFNKVANLQPVIVLKKDLSTVVFQ